MQVVRAQPLARALVGIIIKKRLAKKSRTTKAKSTRGRKPIFTDEQKRVLARMIRGALKEQLRSAARGL
ncbi:MAG: hypothetical protein L6R28_04180 [Planctomycetes bacterium]|nr:hypothetical protein [Planctomycetota bacterium]